MANIANLLNIFTSHFGCTPHGVTSPKYGQGINYRDNSNAPTALVPSRNKPTAGERINKNFVPTTFISVINEYRDTTQQGFTLFCHSPIAITNYMTNKNNELVDQRCYRKYHTSGCGFLKLVGDQLVSGQSPRWENKTNWGK